MEPDPNTLRRKKYFVSADTVFVKKKPPLRRQHTSTCRIIDSSRAALSKDSFRLPRITQTAETDQDIDVRIIKDGDRIKSIRIVCPCGKSTELNCEYNTREAEERNNEKPVSNA